MSDQHHQAPPSENHFGGKKHQHEQGTLRFQALRRIRDGIRSRLHQTLAEDHAKKPPHEQGDPK